MPHKFGKIHLAETPGMLAETLLRGTLCVSWPVHNLIRNQQARLTGTSDLVPFYAEKKEIW